MALWPRGSSLDLDKVTPAVARESVERRDSSVPSVVKNGESAGTLAKLSDVDGRNVSPEFENPTFWRGLFMFLGPGFLISMAYMDPGNLASDINQGAMVGYSIIWVTIWSTVLGYFMQMVAARLGVVTGNDLAHHVRQEYAHPRRALLWILVEIAIITTDMLEVIGGASAFSTLSNGKIPMWAGVVLTGACAFLCLGLESIGMRYLEILLMVLISIMSGTFFYMFGTTNVDYLATLKGMVIPLVKDGTIQYIVGAIGAVIMPHNLFLHSSLMITRTKSIPYVSADRALRFVKIETGIALFISVLINIAAIAAFAGAFFQTIGASNVGIGNAGPLLAAEFNSTVKILWGIGLLAAANASTVTSTYAGQVVMDGFMGWKVNKWYRTAGTRLITLGPTLCVALLMHGEDSSYNAITNWLNIAQSLVLPFVIIPLMVITADPRIMGGDAMAQWTLYAMSIFSAVLIGMNGYLVIDFGLSLLPEENWSKAVVAVLFVVYMVALAVITLTWQRAQQLFWGTVGFPGKVWGAIKQLPSRMSRRKSVPGKQTPDVSTDDDDTDGKPLGKSMQGSKPELGGKLEPEGTKPVTPE